MNRKVFYTILGMTILCGLVFFHSGKSLAANQTGIVTASSLNVRTGAGTSYDILQYNNANVLLAKEDKVTILEKLSGWYQVSFVKDNTTLTGFVSSNYIAIEQASTAVPAPTVTPASTSEPTITYRYETSYQPVSVGAKVLKKSKLYKANGKSVYKVGRKKMSLAKGKKIKVIGEKTLKGKKWFHVSFTYKKKKRKVQKRVQAGDSISQRPDYIDTREEFGHWEMDTVVGPQGKSKKVMLVLTERKTRKEIVYLMQDRKAQTVVKALNTIERSYGERLFRNVFKTITVDNGVEFSDAEGLERSRRNKKKKRTKVYYCHPYSSCERGSNENANRLIRRHIPKGVNFDKKRQSEIKEIETWINNYPRKLFGYNTAEEQFVYEMEKLLSLIHI